MHMPRICTAMHVDMIINHTIIIRTNIAFRLDSFGITEGIWIAKCIDKHNANAKHARDDTENTENKLSKLKHCPECLHWSAKIPNTS